MLALATGWLAMGRSWAEGPEASPESTRDALATAQHWLAEIDAEKYDESYEEGCTAFHNKVSHDEWLTVLKALRPSIGTLVNRKELKHTYKPDGYEGLEGECMVIMYAATFTKLGPTLEVVVLKREDGKWRGAGYNAQPQQGESSQPPPPPESSTSMPAP